MALLLSACSDSSSIDWSDEEKAEIYSLSLSQLDQKAKPTKNSVINHVNAQKFGEQLFFNTRLSQNKDISCASCHQPELNFTDGKEVAQGMGTGSKNTPSIRGAYLNDWQFWDGRNDSLWSQAMGPIENTREMGFNRLALAHLIDADEHYKLQYEELFGLFPTIKDQSRFPLNAGPVDPDKNENLLKAWKQMDRQDQDIINQIFVNVSKAIAAFESTIGYPETALDRFSDELKLTGKSSQLNLEQQQGLQLFIGKANCVECHNGPKLTNGSFHQLGIGRGGVFDLGRATVVNQILRNSFNCLGQYSDANKEQCAALTDAPKTGIEWISAFKTPSLRNLKNTQPYMHNGLFMNLNEVVNFYNRPAKPEQGQSDLKPLDLTLEEQAALVKFLQVF